MSLRACGLREQHWDARDREHLCSSPQPGFEVDLVTASVSLRLLCFDELSSGPCEQAEVSGESCDYAIICKS